MIKAAIFDLDGTLCDTVRDLQCAVNYALKLFGYELRDVSDIRSFIGNGITKTIERSLPENARDTETVMQIRHHFMEYYDAHCLDFTCPYPQVHELLQNLTRHGIKLAVVTNKDDTQSKRIIAALFPDIPFVAVLGNGENAPHKPDITLTLAALKAMGAAPEDCVFIGDSGVDAITAKRAGIFPIGVSWGYRSAEELISEGAKLFRSAEHLYGFVKNF